MFCGLIYREATEHTLQDPTMLSHIVNATRNEITVVKPTTSDKMVDEDESALPKTSDSSSLGDYVVTEADILNIHHAIHDRSVSEVTINGFVFKLQMNDSSCRFVRVDGVVYIEQNKEKKSKYAKMATEGKKITWICHSGNWGLIIDNTIQQR